MAEEDQKRVIKEALKEWMDDKFAQFGKWSAAGLAALALAALVVLILWSQGWHR